jgi:hypothetical protein
MKYIKKFERFRMDGDTQTKPAPNTKPAPTTTPAPSEKPSRPSPIRRDRPAVIPDPLAVKDMPKAEEAAIATRFIELSKSKGIDLKKYF